MVRTGAVGLRAAAAGRHLRLVVRARAGLDRWPGSLPRAALMLLFAGVRAAAGRASAPGAWRPPPSAGRGRRCSRSRMLGVVTAARRRSPLLINVIMAATLNDRGRQRPGRAAGEPASPAAIVPLAFFPDALRPMAARAAVRRPGRHPVLASTSATSPAGARPAAIALQVGWTLALVALGRWLAGARDAPAGGAGRLSR